MTFRVLYHVARADFLERIRGYRFLIVLGLVIAVAFLFVPQEGANYITIDLDGYRGVYNSAWVGGSVALLSTLYLALASFYVVKGAIGRDIETGVGQIVASAPIGKPQYIFGKWLSNFAMLLVMVGVLVVSAGVMQLVRGEELSIDVWALLGPFVIIVLPTMMVVAALAVLFETLPELRGGFGNVVYFFLFLIVLFPAGLAGSFIIQNMADGVQAAVPGHSGGTSCCLILESNAMQVLGRELGVQQTFEWKGMEWTSGILLSRLLYIAAAIGIMLLAARLFNRFDSTRPAFGRFAPVFERMRQPLVSLWRRRRTRADMPSGDVSGEKAYSLWQRVGLTSVTSRLNRFRFWNMLIAELRLMLKGLQWWWYLVAVALIVASLALPPESSHRWLLPAVWVWPVLVWSAMGAREAQSHTDQLVFSAAHPLRRQLPVTWLAGLIVAMLAGIGVLIRLLVDANIEGVFTWVVGAAFIPSLAIALGAWSRGSKLFQIAYLMLWYIGPMQRVQGLDFMGLDPENAIADGTTLIFIGVIFILLVFAVVGRGRQIRT